MRRSGKLLVVQAIATTLLLSACAPTPGPEVQPPARPSESIKAPQATFSKACAQWDLSALEWRELLDTSSENVTDSAGVEAVLSRSSLPSSGANRYNTGVEICPGFLWVVTHAGESRFISLADRTWSEGPKLETSGSTENIAAAGVESGGAVWGFRGSVTSGDWLYLSDAVVDAEAKCVRVDVHRVAISDLLANDNSTNVIYESNPCLDYSSDRRARTPIKTHLGGALAYSVERDELYVSMGDFHLGASQIGQAVAAGLEATELDYESLLDETTALSAVVAISSPSTTPTERIFAKGLRNSLGMTLISDGSIWLTDHGPGGGDELNEILEGANYGWPLTSEGQPYDRSSYPSDSNSLLAPWLDIYQAEVPGAIEPKISWSPAVAPSSLVQYSPSNLAIPEWEGDLIFGTLVGQALIRVTVSGDETIEQSRLEIGERIRHVILTNDGSIALLTDSSMLFTVGR
jgi:glucose/arabinose dehydrogenase